MTGFVVPGEPGPRLDAAGVRREPWPIADAAFRARMLAVHAASATLVLNPLPEEVVATRRGVRRASWTPTTRCSASRRSTRVAVSGSRSIDFQRSGYMETWDPRALRALHTSGAAGGSVGECVCRRSGARAALVCACAICPTGSFGRGRREVLRRRAASRSPDCRGSAPPLLAQHDWVHVLADYGSTVEVRDRGVRVHLARQRRSRGRSRCSRWSSACSRPDTWQRGGPVPVRPRSPLARGHGGAARRRVAARRAGRSARPADPIS